MIYDIQCGLCAHKVGTLTETESRPGFYTNSTSGYTEKHCPSCDGPLVRVKQ